MKYKSCVASDLHPIDHRPKNGPVKKIPLKPLKTDYEGCCKELKNATDTVARRISAFKSLFYYLSNIAEDENTRVKDVCHHFMRGNK